MAVSCECELSSSPSSFVRIPPVPNWPNESHYSMPSAQQRSEKMKANRPLLARYQRRKSPIVAPMMTSVSVGRSCRRWLKRCSAYPANMPRNMLRGRPYRSLLCWHPRWNIASVSDYATLMSYLLSIRQFIALTKERTAASYRGVPTLKSNYYLFSIVTAFRK